MTQPTPPENSPPTSSKPKPKKPGRWRRRILVALGILVILTLLVRALVTMLLPSVINKVARAYNLQVAYDRLDLRLIGGNAALWNFRVLPLEGGDPILRADYLQGDISVIGLLKGRLVVYRAAADGVDVAVEREADGSIPLLTRFVSKTATPAPAAASTTTSSNKPPDLQPPLRIDALRLEHIRARFHDLYVQPNVDARLALDLRLSNLGIAGEPARFELDFSSDPILDTLRVEGHSTGDATQLNASLNVVMRGLHLKPAQGYLASIGLRPTSDNISATMTGNLTASVAPNPADGIKANLTLDNARLSTDWTEAAALDHLAVDIDSLSAGSIKIAKVSIDGVRANAFRNADGSLAVAGVELVPTPPQPPPVPAPVAVAPTSSPFQVALKQFALSGLHLGFTDQAISPPVTFALNSKQIELDDAISDSPAHFEIALESPGLVREIDLTGQATPFSATKTFKLAVNVTGINPVAAKPYLDAAGLKSEWKDGSLSLNADGSMTLDPSGKLTASANLTNFRLADTAELLSLTGAQIKNISLDPQTRTASVDAIDVAGPGLQIHRDSGGNLHLLGFATTKPITTNTPAESTPATPTTSPSAPAPSASPFDNFQLTHFGWAGVKLAILDDSVSPPADLAISDAGFTLDNLTLHLHQTSAQPEQGKFHAWLLAPKITTGFSVDGTITPSPTQTNCDFQVHGKNLNAGALASYLKPLGVEPALKDGSLDLQGKANLDTSGETPKVSLSLNDLKYNDGPQSLVSLGSAAVNGLTTTATGVSLDSVIVQSPHARVLRRADGTIEAAGFHIVGAPPSAPQSANVASPAPPSAPSNFTAALKTLKISAVGIDWTDQSFQTPVQTTLNVNANLADFNFAPDAKPSPFTITANIAGSVDSLTATGNVAASPTAQSLTVDVDASGLRPGPAQAYLPPNIRAKIKNGTFHTAISADVSQNPKGGQAIDLTVKDLDYRDTTGIASILSFDNFHLNAPRIDPSANVVAVDDLTLTGLQTSIHKTSDGIDLLGLELAANPPSTRPPPPAPQIKHYEPTTEQTPPPTTPQSPAQSPQDILRQIAAQRSKLPLVTLRNLDLNVQNISVVDETTANAKPLTISNLRLHNPKPISLLGSDPESNAPTQIILTGKIDPIADNFTFDTRATPFARQKNFNVDLTVSGIHGQGLVDIQPSLAPLIDGSQLTNGQVKASLVAALKLQTVRPSDFDLSHGGKLDFSLTNLAFRADPAGPVLAGIGEIHSEGIVLSPNLAGVDVKELEIDNITGRGEKKSDGIHVCGLILKTPTTQPAPANAPVVKASTAAPPAPPQAPPTPASTNEYKIDRLLVSGIDFRVEDQTCTPPAIIPVTALDLEAQGLSNLAISQDKPIRFNLLATAGNVPLPQTDPNQPANRELFSQVAGSGVVSLYPNLKGWTKLSLNGFELTGVRGIAEQEKIKLGAGTFDADIDLRFPGDGSVDSSTRLVVTDLSLSEPPDGLITRTLRLPAPLDVVIGALADQDGSITIPLNITLTQGKVDSASIVGSGIGALGQVIATAIATSPLKLTGLLGLNAKPDAQPPVKIEFPTGYSALGPDEISRLTALAKRLRKDENLQATLRTDSGSSDVSLARQRVNPDADDALVLATALSRRRADLLSARQDAAAQVRAWLASNDTENSTRGIERLRALDRQLADTENSMDYAYDLLRPGADRQATRRTRAAVLALARARLETIQKFLEGSGKQKIAPDRIHITNPQFLESPPTDAGSVTITILKTK